MRDVGSNDSHAANARAVGANATGLRDPVLHDPGARDGIPGVVSPREPIEAGQAAAYALGRIGPPRHRSPAGQGADAPGAVLPDISVHIGRVDVTSPHPGWMAGTSAATGADPQPGAGAGTGLGPAAGPGDFTAYAALRSYGSAEP
jgi:hypothetical protein